LQGFIKKSRDAISLDARDLGEELQNKQNPTADLRGCHADISADQSGHYGKCSRG
jgi:hypothetical protein